jgi:hypothetical protein
VVDVSDYGVQDGVAFLVMEYLEGENLAERLARDGALSPESIAELMLPICAAVAAIHREGIVHRDLKPENIFLSRSHLGAVQPKVVDFGISKMAEDGGVLTTGSNLLGTPCYMSPEQAEGKGEADALSDQYSLGVILYECATGRRAFEGAALFAILWAIVAGKVEPPRRVRPELPAAFEAMVLRAMLVDPAGRFPSIDALGRELLAFATPPARAVWAPAFASGDGARVEPTTSLEGVERLALADTPARSGPKIRALSPALRGWARTAGGGAAVAVVVALAAFALRGWQADARPPSAVVQPSRIASAPVAVEAPPVAPVVPPAPIAPLAAEPPRAEPTRMLSPAMVRAPSLAVVARAPAVPRSPVTGGAAARARVVAPVAAQPEGGPALATTAPLAPVVETVAPPRRQLGANGAPIDE